MMQLINKKKYIRLLALVIVILATLLTSIYYQLPALKDYYTVNDDTRVHVWVFHHINDNTIFKDYPFLELMKIQPVGYNAIYYILYHILGIDLIFLTKILPFIINLGIALFVFKIGEKFKNKFVGLGASFIFLFQIWAFPTLSGGLPRSFSYLFITAFLFYFIKKNMKMILLTMLLALLVYPISFLIILCVYFGEITCRLLRSKVKKDFMKKKIAQYLLLSFMFVIFMLLIYNPFEHSKNFASLKDVKEMTEFSSSGRVPIYPFKNIIQIILTWSAPLLYITLLLVTLNLIVHKKIPKIRRPIWLLALTGIILHYLSINILFMLHDFRRYTRYTIPLVLALVCSYNLYFLIKDLKKRKLAIYFLGISVIILFIFPTTNSDLITCEHRELYSFLSKQNKDILVAGHPDISSCIPLFAKRKVLMSDELVNPITIKIYNENKQKIFDFFSVYYSNKTEIDKFCRKYGIDFIMVDKGHYNSKYINSTIYFEPWDTKIKEIVKDNKEYYFIKNIESLIRINENIYLYRCK
ncbi:MAG: hypothetical protein ABIC04_01770 [Nanoarchaeota archaeon]